MCRMMIVALSLSVMLAFGVSQQGSTAQETIAEPAAPVLTGSMGFLTYANFGAVDAAPLADAPVGLNIFQLELSPGASVVYSPGDPGMGAHLVESGALTVRDFSVDIVVMRAPRQVSPDTTPGEVLPAGAETRLGPGDGFLFPPLAAGEFRNDGTEPVVLAVSVLFPMGDLTETTLTTRSS